ncbi:hypothetical protein GLS40_06795 [Pseudooceanicola sp. 216_PA32_1]|uniref:Uncharacterized protein n=1 Tax=Pseudooceanicola pacificus TaxID=2676438 RepID=A0A844W1U3_9RHOB|nr:hypothetical protein [Pseudooceanicola pacificus]MWB77727.1 hypothetical protein [Pseudooceanicola pacificus]
MNTKRIAVAAIVAVVSISTVAQAGPISRACMSSDRSARSPSLCGCIQRAADRTLDGRDQRLAAQFFRNPQKAQDVRMSKSGFHNSFWTRYRQFGETAEASCS